MAAKKTVAPSKPLKSAAVEEFGPEDSTPTKDFEAPAMTPPERRKNAPRGTIELGANGTPCVVCGTIGSGVCPVDGHKRGGV